MEEREERKSQKPGKVKSENERKKEKIREREHWREGKSNKRKRR